MSEQPADTNPIVHPEGQPDYGWEHVAQEMQNWHPNLQEHAQRQLEARGLATSPEASAITQDEAPIVNADKAKSSAEKPRSSAEEISGAFADGQRTIYKMSADPHFHAKCLEQGIDPYDDMDKPAYWNSVADYAHSRIGVMRERGGDKLRLSTLELLAATPAFLFEQRALNQNTYSSATERRHGKEVVSYYNGLIREFATEFPETNAADLATSLLNVANIAIEDKTMRQAATQDIRQTIRGAQHETAFGQILERTGRSFRQANLEEDLKGIDYVVGEDTIDPIYIDVKASLSEVEARGSGGAFVRKPDGKIVMYSLVKDNELGNTFFLHDATANTKAPVLNQLLEQTQQRSA